MDNISDISTYFTSLKNKIVNVNEEGLNITDSKGNIAWYIKGFANAAEIRKRVNEIDGLEELKSMIQNIS